jgi:hypothetical protein
LQQAATFMNVITGKEIETAGDNGGKMEGRKR